MDDELEFERLEEKLHNAIARIDELEERAALAERAALDLAARVKALEPTVGGARP